MVSSALVVGGGIGGLSAALAFQQKGIDTTVVERQSDVHSSVFGVGIIQPMNALRALDIIGCAQDCIAEGYAAKRWGGLYSTDGHFIKEMPGTPVPGVDLPPMNGLTRPKLHEILTRHALEAGVTIRYATTFTELKDDGDGVDVTFTDGSTGRYDLVVGADGVYSKTREYVVEGEVAPYYIGQSAYRVNIPLLPEIDSIILQASPAGMAGLVPIGKDLAYLFYNAQMEKQAPDSGMDSAEKLREYLAPFGGFMGTIRDEFITDECDIVLRPEESLIVDAPWHKGRIVLMGDAVHAITPHLGQGAAQAIEDGVVLADSLSKHDNLEDAFAEYTDRRFERCKLVVDTSLDIAEWEMGRKPGYDNVAATEHVLEVMAQPL
ncbi:FAD-dependent oxidoreductase [Nocardioides sp. Kera G14]|uniref:FAD-dependent oxidoreductase n=1 Tax=Nocardioides sp. Kera G14 TaxID=2884264 RepID=UPI001D11BF4A|nr:FAD-dependent oxidoreductase [Nocardioides sp. Kera G14]UDY23463.1 FAD-dependent monooxygenase [Nocardioides sp. Kera G14]